MLHYTGCSLEQSLKIFQNPQSKVSAHLIIDNQGKMIETVPCMKPPCLRAWHAGHSFWPGQGGGEKGQTTPPSPVWWGFNNFSLGVELVNNNGNLFPYTGRQYQALHLLLKKLKSVYPALKNPHRILGHEHIAAHRGKIDPGHQFDWEGFFHTNYPDFHPPPVRRATLPPNLLKRFSTLIKQNPRGPAGGWAGLNTQMERQALKNPLRPRGGLPTEGN